MLNIIYSYTVIEILALPPTELIMILSAVSQLKLLDNLSVDKLNEAGGDGLLSPEEVTAREKKLGQLCYFACSYLACICDH